MSLNSRYKLVLRPEFPTIDGVRSLNGLPEQPFVDTSGNIDMSGNFLLVKNIEAGTQDFTVNDNTYDNKGVINVFSDSSANKVANINFKNTNTHIHLHQNENSRSYSEYQTVVDGSNITTGIISGGNFQTTFGILMDNDMMELCNYKFTYGGNNSEYSTGKYIVPDRESTFYIDGTGGHIQYNTWLDQVNALKPYTYFYKTTNSTKGKFNASYRQSPGSIYQSNGYVPYQGFLGNNVLDVYPPAVINSSPDSSNNHYVDMTKLLPMCVGAIKQLDATVTDLSGNLATTNATVTDLSNNLATTSIMTSDVSGNLATLSGLLNSALASIANLTNRIVVVESIESQVIVNYNNNYVLSTLNNIWELVSGVINYSKTIIQSINSGTEAIIKFKTLQTKSIENADSWKFIQNNDDIATNGYSILVDLSNNQSNVSISDLSGIQFIYDFSSNPIPGSEYGDTIDTYKYYTVTHTNNDNYTITDSEISGNAFAYPSPFSGFKYGIIYNILLSASSSQNAVASLNFNWEIVTQTALPTYTIVKTVAEFNAFNHYSEIIGKLLSKEWGASQYNSTLSKTGRKDLLQQQLTTINNSITIDPSLNFIYDISQNVSNEFEPPAYTYYYSAFENDTLVDISYVTNPLEDPPGIFGIIYDTSL